MSQQLDEALLLSEELLKNIELSELPLASAFLKAARVARLTGDHEAVEAFGYEVGSYPSEPGGVETRIFELARKFGRVGLVEENKQTAEKASLFSVSKLEEELAVDRLQLSMAGDRDISVAYSNPNQLQLAPTGNTRERNLLNRSISTSAKLLAQRRAFLYRWTLEKYYDLKFAKKAYDVFSNTQKDMIALLAKMMPTASEKISAAIDGLNSDNPEHWANAAHSCRRLLQELADAVYPARSDITKTINDRARTIKLGKENYINRLVTFVEGRMKSNTAIQIVGSNISYLGERLDAIFSGTQKGSHSDLELRDAERVVIYTSLMVVDILRLQTTETRQRDPKP